MDEDVAEDVAEDDKDDRDDKDDNDDETAGNDDYLSPRYVYHHGSVSGVSVGTLSPVEAFSRKVLDGREEATAMSGVDAGEKLIDISSTPMEWVLQDIEDCTGFKATIA
ncbi:hypothetical protein Sste5344_003737 [Sporothrix stenoceras]